MSGDFKTPVNRGDLLEAFAAELTRAAYRVALRGRTQGAWLDLELDLWRGPGRHGRDVGGGIGQVPIAGDAACTVLRR
jgi:hypothetical protein